jgi:hypothetical protein
MIVSYSPLGYNGTSRCLGGWWEKKQQQQHGAKKKEKKQIMDAPES